MDIKIDATTAQVISNTCATIATLAGAGPIPAALIGCGVNLGLRLTDAGYEVPSLAALKQLQADISALPELPETEETPNAPEA